MVFIEKSPSPRRSTRSAIDASPLHLCTQNPWDLRGVFGYIPFFGEALTRNGIALTTYQARITIS